MELLPRHRSGFLFAVVAAAIWLFLALRSPSLTHHFAPLIIGGSWAAVGRMEGTVDLALAWLGGIMVALVTYAILAGTGSLQGPPLFEFLPTRVELPVFAIVGATVSGLWQLMKHQRSTADPLRGGTTS